MELAKSFGQLLSSFNQTQSIKMNDDLRSEVIRVRNLIEKLDLPQTKNDDSLNSLNP